MSCAPSKADLDKLTDDEVVAMYNALAANTGVGSGFYLDEIARRSLAKESGRMSDMTRTMKNLTWWIFLLTVVNVGAVVYPLLK